MKRTVLILTLILSLAAFGPHCSKSDALTGAVSAAACNGELGTAWSTSANQCVSGCAGCACDSIAQETCYVGLLDGKYQGMTVPQAIAAKCVKGGVFRADGRCEYAGSAWKGAGLHEGDIVLRVGRRRFGRMRTRLYNIRPRSLTVRRNGRTLYLRVK